MVECTKLRALVLALPQVYGARSRWARSVHADRRAVRIFLSFSESGTLPSSSSMYAYKPRLLLCASRECTQASNSFLVQKRNFGYISRVGRSAAFTSCGNESPLRELAPNGDLTELASWLKRFLAESQSWNVEISVLTLLYRVQQLPGVSCAPGHCIYLGGNSIVSYHAYMRPVKLSAREKMEYSHQMT